MSRKLFEFSTLFIAPLPQTRKNNDALKLRLNIHFFSFSHHIIQKFGARIIIEGAHIGEAKTFAETLVESEGLTYINGYDDPPIVAGAGTMGIEIVDQVPCVDVVVVPVGGAGLIAGVSCAVKTLKPDVKVRDE